MRTVNKITTRIKMPDNILLDVYQDNEPVIMIPRDGSYVEILGHRIDGEFESFDGFVRYLNEIKQTEEENEQLKADKKVLENYSYQMEYYLLAKIEEAKLDRTYVNGVCVPNKSEEIYKQILDKLYEIKGEKNDK